MLDSKTLRSVAEDAGILPEFYDNNGVLQVSSDNAISRILSSLGYGLNNDASLLKSAEKKHKNSILPPVKVITENNALTFDMYLGVTANTADFSWVLVTEKQEFYQGQLADIIIADERKAGGHLTLQLPQTIPLGYHQLTLKRKKRKSPLQMTIIVVPEQCFKSQALLNNEKCWGVNVQLYSLRSEQNWGIGDFTDLTNLMEHIADCGGHFVGVNPLHSLFLTAPESASPYSPSSRYWLNPIYIDVVKTLEFGQSKQAQILFSSAEFQDKLATAKNVEYVDYALVTELKLTVLKCVFDTFYELHLSKNTGRAQAYADFVKAGGDSLLKQATFDALLAYFNVKNHCSSWQDLPKQYQNFAHKSVQAFISENKKLIDFYCYLQWIAAEQLTQVQQVAMDKGMSIGLYRDLAVGVTDCGSEAWSNENGLCLNAAIGAPADALAPNGQNWGLLPFDPVQLKSKAYKPFIDLLRANMQDCGALRIDHILGLKRLWWVTKGESAKEGAYLSYPLQDLLGILALESQRNQCVVIGEDLGTVPADFTDQLQKMGIFSYKVFLFEVAPDGGFYSPSHYLPQSLSALCTHDMPTLKGYWDCSDLKHNENNGIEADKNTLMQGFVERAEKKQNILDSVNWHGNLPEQTSRDAAYAAMDKSLSFALQQHLATGSSALLSLQLEDWLGIESPVNIPGTTHEYPNWRRKLTKNIADIFADESIQSFTQTLTRSRQQ